MDSYSAAYVQAERAALRALPCWAYCVLRYLCSRADELGRCFPSVATIAQELGYDSDSSIYEALDLLESRCLIGYLRRNERDLLTGKPIPNVYQISPYYLMIREELIPEALRFWLIAANGQNPRIWDISVQESSERRDESGIPDTNQQHNQIQKTNDSGPDTKTNNNNQRAFEKVRVSPVQNYVKSDIESAETPDTAQTEVGYANMPESRPTAQRTAKATRVPPRPARPADDESRLRPRKYDDADPQPAPFPDGGREMVARSINRLGIPLPLARGFLNQYGVSACQSALLITCQEQRTNPGGFFRYILQRRLTGTI